MKVSLLGLLHLAVWLMIVVVVIVPPQFIVVVLVVQLGLIVAIQFVLRRRKPRKPIDFSSSTWTVDGDLTGYGATEPIHPR
jgi:hypothetical protein